MILKLLPFILIGILSFSGFNADEWEEYIPENAGFKVLLPGDPDKKIRVVETKSGNLNSTTYMLLEPDLMYYVIFADYPDYYTNIPDPHKLLSGVWHKAIKKCNGKIEFENPITLGKNPGREFLIKTIKRDREVTTASRVFLVKNRLYQVCASSHSDYYPKEKMEYFVKSFKIEN